jgi:pimeloyl-ACP methyl ester carboxylesterase
VRGYCSAVRVNIGDDVRLFVDIDGHQLVPDSEAKAMRERPTIVAMHGGPGLDHVGLKLALAPLCDVAQIIVYDHRGHGRSDRGTPDEWTLDTWADDLVRLCDVLGIESPIVLGNSFGGFVAQRYLGRHPGHASKVILYASMSVGDLDTIVEGFRAAGGDAAADAAKDFWSGPSARNAPAFLEHCRPCYSTHTEAIASDALTMRNDAVLAHFIGTSVSEMWTMDLRSDIANVTCPVLVLSGARDPVCGPSPTAQMLAALPSALTTSIEFKNSSHMIARDEPDAFLDAIRAFVTTSHD